MTLKTLRSVLECCPFYVADYTRDPADACADHRRRGRCARARVRAVGRDKKFGKERERVGTGRETSERMGCGIAVGVAGSFGCCLGHQVFLFGDGKFGTEGV